MHNLMAVWTVVVPCVPGHQHLQEIPGVQLDPEHNNNNSNKMRILTATQLSDDEDYGNDHQDAINRT